MTEPSEEMMVDVPLLLKRLGDANARIASLEAEVARLRGDLEKMERVAWNLYAHLSDHTKHASSGCDDTCAHCEQAELDCDDCRGALETYLATTEIIHPEWREEFAALTPITDTEEQTDD